MLQRTPEAFVDKCRSLLMDSGYTVALCPGWLEGEVPLLQVCPATALEPEINPAFHDLTGFNVFWLSVTRHGDDHLVGCLCVRMIDTSDLIEDLRTNKTTYGSEADAMEPLYLAMEQTHYPKLSGTIALVSGRYVAPEEAPNGLHWFMDRIAGALASEQWPDLQAMCAISRGDLQFEGLPGEQSYLPATFVLAEGSPPGSKIYLSCIPAPDMLLRVAEDLALIEMNVGTPIGEVYRDAVRRVPNDAAVLVT